MNNSSSIAKYQSYGPALVLLTLLALLNFNSVSGIMRGGDEDEGSGIGGTGRMAVPSSESGFGGTGFKPFLGLNSELEIEVQRAAEPFNAQPINAVIKPISIDSASDGRSAIPELVETAVIAAERTEFTSDSSAISITESIQRDFDSNGLQIQQLKQSVAANSTSYKQEIQELKSNNSSSLNTDTLTEEVNASLNWSDVARFLSSNLEKNISDSTLASLDENSAANNASRTIDRPTRIQRPELPPLQRARPLQRLNILPPQIKPLAL